MLRIDPALAQWSGEHVGDPDQFVMQDLLAQWNESEGLASSIEKKPSGGGNDERPEAAVQASDDPSVTDLKGFFDPPGNDHVGDRELKVDTQSDGSKVIWGTSSNDHITGAFGGTQFDDTIYGGAGEDEIEGGGGSDTIYGGADNDTIWGDSNDNISGDGDHLYGGAGYDTIYGGAGGDYIFAGADGAKAYGQDGDDWMFGGDGADTFFGNADDDHLFGYAGNDELDGGAGNDTILGGDDEDTIDGGIGHDLIFGGDGKDTIEGGDGDDAIDGGSGKDTVMGGADHDTIKGGSGDDELYGEAGNDTIAGGLGADYIDGGSGQDVFVYEHVWEFGDQIDGVDTTQGISDKFDFAKIFNGAVADVQQAIAGGYLQWVQNGPDVVIQIDIDGGGDGFMTAATLIDTDAAKIGDYMFIV